jgi:4-amino-4-deoxy-L-arabinose transferase-like glycosyltransferase
VRRGLRPEARAPKATEPGGRTSTLRTGWLVPAGLVLLTAALRLYHVGVPFVDVSDWRQTDTASIAYFYYRSGIALLHPQLWHDGPGPDYTQLELQIAPALAALLAHLVGYSDTLLRLVAIGLFSLSVLPLWDLVRRRLGPEAALWCGVVYALLPLGVYFGRAFQAEPAMMCAGNLALWAADRYGARPGLARWLALVAAAALAVLAKLPNALLLLPMAALALGPGRPWRRLWRQALPLAGLVVLPSAAAAWYTLAVGRVAAHGGSEYVDFIVRSLGDAYLTGNPSLASFAWRDGLGLLFTPPGALAAAYGAWRLAPRVARGRHLWLAAWLFALLAYAAVVLRTIRLQYYLLPLEPFVAVLAGEGLAALPAPWGRPALRRGTQALAAGLILGLGLLLLRTYWPPYWPWYRLGTELDRDLPPSATIVLGGTENPTVFYYARRHGWRLDPVTPGAVAQYAALGAGYLVPAVALDPCLAAYLDAHYRTLLVGDTTVWDLQEPLRTPAVPAAPQPRPGQHPGQGVGAADACAATGQP